MAYRYKARTAALTKSGKVRKKPHEYEGNEQTQLINWIRGSCRRGSLPENVEHMIFAVPNGGHRHIRVAEKLKAQGQRAGVSDLVIPIARGGYFGLFIEFKASPPHSSSITKEQRQWLERVRSEGYAGVLSVGIEEAKRHITNYMSLPVTTVKDTTVYGDTEDQAVL